MHIVFKLLNVFIDCPEIVCYLNFIVPQCRTKSTTMFYVFTRRKKMYALASSINRIMSITNEINIELLNFNCIDNYINRIYCI